MGSQVTETGNAVKFTTSSVLKAGPVTLLGIFVSTCSNSPTIEVLNAVTSGSGTVISQFTPVAGTFYPMPIGMGTGFTVLTGGSVTASAIFLPT